MLTVSLRQVKSAVILDLSGNIDIDSSILIEKIGLCLDNGYQDLLCNFENVDLIDYSGLSVLTIAYKNVINHKGRIKFANVAAHLAKVLSLVCMDRVFEIYIDEESAIKSFEEDKAISEIQNKKLRRRFKRLDLGIDISFKSKSEDKLHSGKVLNLSGVGVLVFTEEKTYPTGELLDLVISLLPKPGIIEVEAKVAWLVEKDIQPHLFPGMGLEFYNLDTLDQKKIIEFIDRNIALDIKEY
ncbi:MAG: PilZ domain-containing protein [Candidatus Omnitrophota bacterium]|nr:PilZ domain-containing protein [Candidatus Omnitrophota bacterium]MBU1929318.1 PilZ domain-containing protein [Candidatus Omnitrophota bacterium]MBU2035610.1 PilZ domain-containing protein [Candidatus Omnitrophota bacterium]MBU2221598.1 PilZ domain-containing protein [Candidatus Omnitrophota bacterium]MBU2258135.1 PilZ domain-containing protein [Candidatus Omnitrophota bacterium]